MDIYAQNILDRYKKPFHKGALNDFNIEHSEANHSCGDKVSIQLTVDGDKVVSYGFEGEGCAISMAAADILGDLIDEMAVDEVLALDKETLYEALGIEISVRRSKCALLALLSLQNGLLANKNSPLKSWSDYMI